MVLTAKNCADVVTKPVSSSVPHQLCKSAGLVFYWPCIPHHTTRWRCAEQKTETDTCQNWLWTSRRVQRLSETIGRVEELSTSHDEWAMTGEEERKKKRRKPCATSNRVNIDRSHLGYLKSPRQRDDGSDGYARFSGLDCVRTREQLVASTLLMDWTTCILTDLTHWIGWTRTGWHNWRVLNDSHSARCERVFFVFVCVCVCWTWVVERRSSWRISEW